jgi:phosphatidylglycerophosphate synthase
MSERGRAKEGLNLTDEEAAVDRFGEKEIQYSKRFYRYISVKISKHMAKTPITPNQVTGLALLCGLLAAYLFTDPTHMNIIFAAILVQLAVLLDYVDGNIARYKHMSSMVGRFFEGVVDRVIDVLVFFGVTYGLYFQTGDIAVWMLGFIAISSRTLINVTQFMFQKEAPYASEAIDEVQGSRILREFYYTRTFIYALLLVTAVINKLYYFLLITAVYGIIFYIGEVFMILKKIKKYEG